MAFQGTVPNSSGWPAEAGEVVLHKVHSNMNEHDILSFSHRKSWSDLYGCILFRHVQYLGEHSSCNNCLGVLNEVVFEDGPCR